MRVVTTVKINSPEEIGYLTVAQNIIKTDGVVGLIGRGLVTKVISNGIQAMLFSVRVVRHHTRPHPPRDTIPRTT